MDIFYTLLICLLLFLLHKFYTTLTRPPPPPLSKLPIIGVPPGLFGRTKAGFNSFLQVSSMIAEGYSRFGRYSKPFLVPDQFSGYMVVLPPCLVAEVKAAPDSELSMSDAFEDENATKHTFFMDIWKVPWHLSIVRDGFTAGNLGRLLPSLLDEVERAFGDEWPMAAAEGEGGWKEVDLWEWGIKVIARATHRTLVGLPLCRDQRFLKTCVDFSVGVVKGGWVLRGVSDSLRPWLSPIFTLHNRYRVRIIKSYIKPLILARMKIVEHNANPLNSASKIEPPNDFLYWATLEAHRLGKQSYSVHSITIRFLLINFAAIHTTSLTFVDTIVNMASFFDKPYQSDLRAEIFAVSAAYSDEAGGEWSRKKFAMLYGLDSFIKETLRLHITSSAGLMKKVAAKDGFCFSNGLWLPRGTKVCVPTYSMHLDENLYADAGVFDGYRFSKPWRQTNSGGAGADAQGLATEVVGGDERDVRKASMLAATDDYFPFGGGRHVCPGRFFASNELKVLIKYVLTNYELRPMLGGRPEKTWFGINMIPDFGIKLGLRKWE